MSSFQSPALPALTARSQPRQQIPLRNCGTVLRDLTTSHDSPVPPIHEPDEPPFITTHLQHQMSYSYDRYETQRRRQTYGASPRRSTLGYWVPLALTITAATIGLAAWIWSERDDDDDNNDEYDDRGARPPPGYRDAQPDQGGYARREESLHAEADESMMARMSGALRRTPSPQQLFDGARERVVAGVTAAGAVVGGALSSIREEDKRDFEDHSRWSEEASARAQTASKEARSSVQTGGATRLTAGLTSRQARPTGGRRKAVAIVVSADVEHHGQDEQEVSYLQEHAVSWRFPNPLSLVLLANFPFIVDPLPPTPTHGRRNPRLRPDLRPLPNPATPLQALPLHPTQRLHRLFLLKHRPRRPAHPRRRSRQTSLQPQPGSHLSTHPIPHVRSPLHASPRPRRKPHADPPLHDPQRTRAPPATPSARDGLHPRSAVGGGWRRGDAYSRVGGTGGAGCGG